MVNTSYSFQNVNDARTAIAWSVSAVGAVAIAVSFVALTYFQFLPDFQFLPEYGYYIAGGGFVSALLAGALAATLRADPISVKSLSTPLRAMKEVEPKQINEDPPEPPKVNLSFDEIYIEDMPVKLNRNHMGVLPPDETWPFTSATFDIKVKGSAYELRVGGFVENDGKLYAYVIDNGIKKVHIAEQYGWSTAEESLKGMAYNKRTLNESLKKGNYLSLSDACELYEYILKEDATSWFARAFKLHMQNGKNICEFQFYIPGLINFKLEEEDKIVRFEVDSKIYSEQIALLKKFENYEGNRFKVVAEFLENPIWEHSFKNPDSFGEHIFRNNPDSILLTREGNTVAVKTEKSPRACTDS